MGVLLLRCFIFAVVIGAGALKIRSRADRSHEKKTRVEQNSGFSRRWKKFWKRSSGDVARLERGRTIMEAFRKGTKVTILHLKKGTLDDVKYIAEKLETNTTLTTLALEHWHLGLKDGDAAASKIAEALGKNSTLTTLGLGGNIIDSEGAARIAEALEKNSTLTTLKVLLDYGAKETARIVESLEKNRRDPRIADHMK